ncbi:hypothetical protein EST38_g12057 [Candolleomyces aberdarensis]|uniref:ATP-dependent DNA helicase n=1 Tax=Candolleomyces aberdarensis TaxID=2316362 RepID=A0A4Q2D3C8_9AGAR|nr:hypothetical protein EST38_g12057 [Candolleomyces aberdarensis]
MELSQYAPGNGRDLAAGRYELLKYVHVNDVPEVRELEPHAVCLDVPLRVLNPDQMAIDILREFCADVKPERFEEAGCASCGQLTLRTDLVPLQTAGCSLDPLVEPNLARLERYSPAENIRFETGPVLAKGCSDVCPLCIKYLRRGHRPVNALANGLWVGEVPNVLSMLTYAEQCLVARVRTNRYVVRVASGQSKLMGNAIAFPNPTAKVYHKLPPPREELDEVLAFIFTGVKPPSEEDLGRTPMLVRRNVVGAALEWLRLNHADYSDLHIDADALNSYPESGVPVQVVYRACDEGTNVVAASTSVHEVAEEFGTDAGPCTFTVHGLVGTKLDSMSMSARKAAALHHLRSGGHVLAVGHSDVPESMYDNPQFYPQMYPWLFPYGVGGLGNARTRGLVSETKHKRLLLLYHDKRFQTDARFVLLAFNHEQMKAGTSGSFILAQRSNFDSIVRGVSMVDPAVVMGISNRLKAGERVVPQTDDEKRCFSLMDQIEHVGASVHGSLSGKKIMRSELWSLVAYQGAPSWFVTLSPVDTKHPICIYWADKKVKFDPIARGYNDRARLVASNPVAGARFFHFLVGLFVKHMLRWSDPKGRPGLFGNTAAYYGTVEQQGRMTLHLHMLIWVSGSLSPKDVRERLLSEDSAFQRDLVAYLESCQIGEFMTGPMSDIKSKFAASEGVTVDDPTQRLPVPPPLTTCPDYSTCNCDDCNSLREWVESYKETVDNVLFRSNVHKCYVKRDVVVNGVHKQHVSGKGCINKDGVCTARFPREIYQSTQVDGEGRIVLKKLEPLINTVNPIMAYAFACNTDTTSLGSGTAVNATVGYVADYIVKMGLKSYQIFSSVYDVFERNVNIWNESKSEGDAARRLVLKMANSLTSKVEIGGPMASLYLLGNPDRYASHSFVPLYWRQYVGSVMRTWEAALSSAYNEGSCSDPNVYASFNVPAGTKPDEISDVQDDVEVDNGHENQDNVLVTRTSTKFISRSHVDDYALRPLELEHLCVYDWVRGAVRKSKREIAETRSTYFRYAAGHPLRDSHFVVYNEGRSRSVIPNITGGYLPRHDGEDKDAYGCIMLSLFAPWRTGLELRSNDQTWGTAFDAYPFSTQHRRIIDNLKIRYECYDARDDFHAQLRLRLAAQQNPDGDEAVEADTDDEGDLYPDNMPSMDESDLLNQEAMGVWTKRRHEQMKDAEDALYSSGWVIDGCSSDIQNASSLSGFVPERLLPASKWKELLNSERKKVLASRSSPSSSTTLEDDMDIDFSPHNDARVIPGSYLLSDFKLNDIDIKTHMLQIATRFNLNEEQERAFRIVANHSVSIDPEPLQMYIGGMGGTGKSTVIDALKLWFQERGESYRMIVLAPTGAAASIIGGSTYHSYLGVKTGERRAASSGDDPSLDDARKRMFGVVYVFLDEISMVSCQDFYLIDLRLKDITKVHDLPFGGLSMIVAGDFAQLPPAKGVPLYSGEVAKTQSPRQVQKDQENTIGLLLWHQFTTVVILRKNMRQDTDSPEDTRLRTALEHMRFKDCTASDLDFLRSRIPAYNGSIDMTRPAWKDVSVITAWNTHKDQINEMNAVRFARERGKVLHHFYSVDKQSQSLGLDRRQRSSRSSAKPLKLSAPIQECLWRSPPFTSQHIAACLPLCIDMPIMIRDFKESKLQGGLSGYLRQEFRELDILDEITKLRYHGSLPPTVVQKLRDSTLSAYKEYQTQSSNSGPSSNSINKRSSSECDPSATPSKRRKTEHCSVGSSSSPRDETAWLVSWLWDSVDWSCAFDAYLTILSVYLGELAQGFADLERSATTLVQDA